MGARRLGPPRASLLTDILKAEAFRKRILPSNFIPDHDKARIKPETLSRTLLLF